MEHYLVSTILIIITRERKWKLLEVKPRAPQPGSGQTLEETEAELPGGPAVLEGSSATSDADAVSHRDGEVKGRGRRAGPFHEGSAVNLITSQRPHLLISSHQA